MTLEAPVAGNHPVSGTREFGIEPSENGGFNIYVRGVDRIDSNFIENVAYAFSLGNPFFGADNLWEGFQENMENFVNSNSGASVIIDPVTNRADWEKIKQVLEGSRPISELGCN